jgi:hypothetical protein
MVAELAALQFALLAARDLLGSWRAVALDRDRRDGRGIA